MSNQLRLWVPSYFWNDHADRCPSDDGEDGMCIEVRSAGNRTLLAGTPKQIETLRSDAAFYAAGNVDDCPQLIRSAKSTLAAITKATKKGI